MSSRLLLPPHSSVQWSLHGARNTDGKTQPIQKKQNKTNHLQYHGTHGFQITSVFSSLAATNGLIPEMML